MADLDDIPSPTLPDDLEAEVDRVRKEAQAITLANSVTAGEMAQRMVGDLDFARAVFAELARLDPARFGNLPRL